MPQKEKKPKYKSVMFTKPELKAAWFACGNYTTKFHTAKTNAAQARATTKLQKALLEILL